MSETTNSSMEVKETENISFECVTIKNQKKMISFNSSSSISGQFAKSKKNVKSDLRNSKFYIDVKKTSNAKPEHDTDVQQTSENVTTVKYEPLGIESLILYEGDRTDANSDENLPNGWINVTHTTGIPLYIHEETKVCSFAKPYYIGKNSVRDHDIPLASIPCLNQKLKLQQMDSENNDGNLSEVPEVVTGNELHEYCKNLFRFKTAKYKQFDSWKVRREYDRKAKINTILKQNVPGKILFLPAQQSKKTNEENEMLEKYESGHYVHNHYAVNIKNKTHLAVLCQYVQNQFKTRPTYEMKALENLKYPQMCTILLHGIRYGTAAGVNRKIAKQLAARSTLDILVPFAEERIQMDPAHRLPERQGRKIQEDTLFNEVPIKDPKIPELCNQVGELLPFDLLDICIKSNFGEHEEVKYTMKPLENVSNEENVYHCVISFQNHSTTVFCKNEHEGCQKGAQALLQVLHPCVDNFGSIQKLYSQSLDSESTDEERREMSPVLRPKKPIPRWKLGQTNPEIQAGVRDAMASPETYLY